MTEAILFNGYNSLDFENVRRLVGRVPEVSTRLHTAQNLLDRRLEASFDFFYILQAEDEVFHRNRHLKKVLASIVQLGLWDRYRQRFASPRFVIGPSAGDSPLELLTGEVTFQDWLFSQDFVRATSSSSCPRSSSERDGRLALVGGTVTRFLVYERAEPMELGIYSATERASMDVQELVRELVDKTGLQRLVNIGPGNQLLGRNFQDTLLDEVQILESIDLDPMLAWFWQEVRRGELAAGAVAEAAFQ